MLEYHHADRLSYALPGPPNRPRRDQEALFFSLPRDRLDACLHVRDEGVPPAAVAQAVGLAEEDVRRACTTTSTASAAPRTTCTARRSSSTPDG
jgi:hypothetical protein